MLSHFCSDIFFIRYGPPKLIEVSSLAIESIYWKKEFKDLAGIHSRITSSDTVWPNGCVESESKSGISSYWTVREGGPEAQQQVIAKETKQRANNNPGPVGRVIPCRGFASLNRGVSVHTA